MADPYEPGPLDCCEHCKHSINDPPHDRPCPQGCNTSLPWATTWAYGNCDMGVQPEAWHHGEALPIALPGERCER